MIGRVAIPQKLAARVDAYNRSLLLQRLHEDDVFDVDLKLRDGDRLQLTFRCSERGASGRSAHKVITYGYTWNAGRWTEESFNPLFWQWHHNREMFGELAPSLE